MAETENKNTQAQPTPKTKVDREAIRNTVFKILDSGGKDDVRKAIERKEYAPAKLDVILDAIYEYEENTTRNETSPDISAWDRFKIKNFGENESTDKSIQYLSEKYPDNSFAKSIVGGNVEIGRKDTPGGLPHVLDPRGLDIGDVGDIAWDTGAALTTGVASGVGTLFGGPGGAAAAEGLTSTGLEYARQKIGQYLGVHGETDHTSAITSGVLGGLFNRLLGSGTTAKEIERAVVPKAKMGTVPLDMVERDAALKLNQTLNVEAGFPVHEASEFPKLNLRGDRLGSEENFIPGLQPTDFNNRIAAEAYARENKGALVKAPHELAAFVSNVPVETLEKLYQPAPAELKAFMAESGIVFNPEKATYLDLAKKVAQNPTMVAEAVYKRIYDALEGRKNYVGGEIGSAIQEAESRGVRVPLGDFTLRLQERIRTLRQYKKEGFLNDALSAELQATEDYLSGELTRVVVRTKVDPVTGEVTKERVKIILDEIPPKALFDRIQSLKSVFEAKKKELGATSHTQLEAIQMEIEKGLSDALYGPMGIDRTDLKEAYAQVRNTQRMMEPDFGSPQAIEKTMRNSNSKTYGQKRDTMREFDDSHGTNLADVSDVIKMYTTMVNPESQASGHSSKGNMGGNLGLTVGTALAGGTAKALGADTSTAAFVGLTGGAIGRGAGTYAASPAGVEAIYGAANAPAKVGDWVAKKLRPFTKPTISSAQSAMNLLSESGAANKLRNFRDGVAPIGSRQRRAVDAVSAGRYGIRGGGVHVPSVWNLMQDRGEISSLLGDEESGTKYDPRSKQKLRGE